MSVIIIIIIIVVITKELIKVTPSLCPGKLHVLLRLHLATNEERRVIR